ncbi:MAG TPA: IclR family transcriptional regulator [Hyphomonas sp.]|nr:IclR family transcriptional regulator [Hyphomonas sp.]
MEDRPIKSAQRTLFLFELFATYQTPLTISDISLKLQLPQSSTSVLVRTLVTLGYLSCDSKNRTYYPTPRITLLGTWMLRRHEATGNIPKLLAEIAQATGESVVLAMRNGIYAQYLLAQTGPDPLRLHVETGLQRPLACSAAGWALLGLVSDTEIGRLVRRTVAEAPDPLWKKTAPAALEHIKATRSQGYAMSNGETTRGAGAIAMMLPSSKNIIPLAAAVGGPLERIREKEELIRHALQDLGREITTLSIQNLVGAS